MTWVNFKDVALYVLISGWFLVFVYFLKKLIFSIDDLNIKMAVIINQVTSHGETLEKHGERLNRIEYTRRGK